MDKKSIGGLAILVFFIVFWYSVVIPSIPEDQLYKEKPHVPTPEVSDETPAAAPLVVPGANLSSTNLAENIEKAKGVVAPAPVKLVAEKVIDLHTDTFHARFNNKGGQLVYLALNKFHPEAGSEAELVLSDLPSFGFGSEAMAHVESTEGDMKVIIFTGSKAEITYKFKPDSHFFDLQIKRLDGLQKTSFVLGGVSSSLGAGASSLAQTNEGGVLALTSRSYGDNSEIYYNSSLQEDPVEMKVAGSDLSWAGWRSKYFAWLIQPLDVNQAGHKLNYYYENKNLNMLVDASGQSVFQYQIYAGPIDKNVLYKVDKDLYMPLFNYTGIDIIIHFLLWLLSFYNSIPGINMGFAIIMLTITVKLCLFPLTLKSQTSMFMMSKLGPKIKELQEKYKNDRQALGMKQMELFKENGVNPLAGCLPMLIQMPVFISLFSTIGEGFDLRQANFFGWMADLSAPDRFGSIPFHIPFIGNGDSTTNLNLLPFLYIITMFIQQSLMPKSTDPQQQQMQKMMKFMMMGFAVILYNYSSGLMVYFVGSNILGMTESYYIRNKVMPKLEAKIKS